MKELDKLKELFDIAWEVQVNNKHLGKELARKVMLYMPDILQQFDYLQSKEEEQCSHDYYWVPQTERMKCKKCGAERTI